MSVRCKMGPKGKEPLYVWAHRMVQEGHSAFGGCGPCTAATKVLRERKARKIGLVAMIGGKDKTRIREATPEAFRDLLLSIARTARPCNIKEAAEAIECGHDECDNSSLPCGIKEKS